jgi:aminopeptidase-like protein
MSRFEGPEMYGLIVKLFPILRSITGNGVRETLAILGDHMGGLAVSEIPTGETCFDWTIPNEWNLREAFIEDSTGRRIIDFKEHNLHVLNYSAPVDGVFSLEELTPHIYTLPNQPDAIPYRTSYYVERWGFCMAHSQFAGLKPGNYRVKIDSTLAPGSLTYADKLIPGIEEREVLLSTYVCHPSMANNELSGPALAVGLYHFLSQRKNRYSYRFVFVPETIGAVVYLSRNLATMKKNTIAGFQLTCVGDKRGYSFVPSRNGGTLADRIAKHILDGKIKTYDRYTYLDRGSDERQYCAPGVDLPVVSLLRTKYGKFPEYHTSMDNLDLVSPEGLQGSLDLHKDCIRLLEENRKYQVTTLGEPQLGKRNLRNTVGAAKRMLDRDRMISNLLAYCDGKTDLVDLGETFGVCALELLPFIEELRACDLLRIAE